MYFPDICLYINKLKIRQTSLEKAESHFIRIIDAINTGNIQEEYDKLKNFREHDFNDVRREVQENLSLLKQIKTESGRALIEIITKEMRDFENSTGFIKQRISDELEILTNEEMALTIDVTNIEMKIPDMNKPEKEINNISKYSIKYTNDQQLQEEVQEFSSFLNETGGHTGGWTDEDNLLFLKAFNRIKNKRYLTQCLQKQFPDMKKDNIEHHIDWYKSYAELRNKQRLAIEKWRENKNKIGMDETNKIIKVEDRVKSKINMKHNKIVKEKVQKWKEKKKEKIEKDIKIQTDISNKIKETEKQKQEQDQLKKNDIKKWKTARETKERAENLAKELTHLREQEKKMLLANKLIREFQEQDNIFITKRMNKLNIEVTPPNSGTSLKNLKMIIARNPDRLHQPTKQWIARTSETSADIHTMNDIQLMLKSIPKLAAPSWRQSIQ